jgi:spermidine synthase
VRRGLDWSPGLFRLELFVLLGALLLFGLEPLVGRLLLPSSGGGFHVWATCLMFFQGVLFAGYLYCHSLAPRLGRWHLLVLCLPLVLLTPLSVHVDPDPHAPVASLLWSLTLHIGPPFFALATTGVVAQDWLARSGLPGSERPYRLYAMSNLGSLVALLSYPLLVEPFLGLATQRWVWTGVYVAYLGVAWWAFPKTLAPLTASQPVEDEGPDPPAPTGGEMAFWFYLAAAPSMFLLAVTNVIALDVGSAPLVWVVPLAIYLGSFILTFGRWSLRPFWIRRFWPEVAAVGVLFFARELGGVSWLHLLGHLIVLAVVCMAAHGELHRSRPAPAHLTTFYLVLSLGGWAGGAFVVLAAPRLFTGLLEYPAALGLLALTLLVGRRDELLARLRVEPLALLAGSVLLLSVIGVAVVERLLVRSRQPQYAHRSAYGVYRVSWSPHPDQELAWETRKARGLYSMFHGTTLHGKQLEDPVERRQPIGYYHPSSPLGDVLGLVAAPRQAAVIGLGVGTAAAYFGSGEEVTFYELDPAAHRLAEDSFWYLADARDAGARVEVVYGDARLSLSRADVPDGRYDVILVDAFSSDSIPTHLMTREALALYADKLRPQGYLVFHVSSRYYDLRPVLQSSSQGLGIQAVFKARRSFAGALEDASSYCVFRLDGQDLEPLRALGWESADELALPQITAWTDDYANILAPLWAGTDSR